MLARFRFPNPVRRNPFLLFHRRESVNPSRRFFFGASRSRSSSKVTSKRPLSYLSAPSCQSIFFDRFESARRGRRFGCHPEAPRLLSEGRAFVNFFVADFLAAPRATPQRQVPEAPALLSELCRPVKRAVMQASRLAESGRLRHLRARSGVAPRSPHLL